MLWVFSEFWEELERTPRQLYCMMEWREGVQSGNVGALESDVKRECGVSSFLGALTEVSCLPPVSLVFNFRFFSVTK